MGQKPNFTSLWVIHHSYAEVKSCHFMSFKMIQNILTKPWQLYISIISNLLVYLATKTFLLQSINNTSFCSFCISQALSYNEANKGDFWDTFEVFNIRGNRRIQYLHTCQFHYKTALTLTLGSVNMTWAQASSWALLRAIFCNGCQIFTVEIGEPNSYIWTIVIMN